MSKSVTIDECTEGYLVRENGTTNVFAVSENKVVEKVKELLGITETNNLFAKKLRQKTPSVVRDSGIVLAPHGISIIEDESIPKGTVKFVNTTEFVLKDCDFPTSTNEFISFDQDKMSWSVSKDDRVEIKRKGYLSPVTLMIKDLKYLYDHPKESEGIIQKFGKDTYSNKSVILRAFMREVPFEKITYHEPALLQKETKAEPVGQEDGSCDDISFDSCANNKPDNCKHCVNQSRYENKSKLAAMKPSPPSLRASVPP